jgi:hypothetical protein
MNCTVTEESCITKMSLFAALIDTNFGEPASSPIRVPRTLPQMGNLI